MLPQGKKMKPFLKTQYEEKIAPALREKLGYGNVHEIPGVTKVVLNTGFNTLVDKSTIEDIVRDIGLIAGQKPVITKARKSVSNFKLREGMPIGCMVTLRGARMWDFLYRLIAIALPAIRDFRGISAKLDGNGNYSIGITDHSIFPEINTDNQKHQMGLDITIVTTASTDDEGRELLREMGMPFRKRAAAGPAAPAQ